MPFLKRKKNASKTIDTPPTSSDVNLIGHHFKSKSGSFRYTLQSIMETAAFKIYVEQIQGYTDYYIASCGDFPFSFSVDESGALTGERTPVYEVIAEQVNFLENALYDKIRTAYDKNEAQVFLMKHDQDPLGDDIWAPSMEKPHYHIIIRLTKRSKLSTIMYRLGIHFRPHIDDLLFANHGVEATYDFNEYVLYLMHETKKARLDGKPPYSWTKFISNLSQDEIQQLIDGYKRIVDSSILPTMEDWIRLDKAAYDLGFQLGDFDQWYNALPFTVRQGSRVKTIKESYQRGIMARVKDGASNCILRLCVYIQGPPNKGKTYAASGALNKLGISYICVEGGGTGRFDNLKPSHRGILVNDDELARLLNLSDNYFTQVYRRGNNNPFWCGDYLIVTSNLDFDTWLYRCGCQSEHYRALRSRFFICKTKDNGTIDLLSASERGSNTEKIERIKKFNDFADAYDEIALQYKPDDIKIDYNKLLGKRCPAQYKSLPTYEQLSIFGDSCSSEHII